MQGHSGVEMGREEGRQRERERERGPFVSLSGCEKDGVIPSLARPKEDLLVPLNAL